jgi:hypothetical protein
MQETKKIHWAYLFLVCLSAAVLISNGTLQAQTDSGLRDLAVPNQPTGPALTDQQINTLVALEATQNETSSLTLKYGQPMTGSWSGNVTSTGWNLTFTGSINGQGTSITENGTLNNTTASWKDNGTVGGTGFSGSGTAIVNGSTVKWKQQVGGDPIPIIKIIQLIVCIVSPSNCKVATMVSAIFGVSLMSSQVDLTTGVVFGSNVQQPSLQTTAEEGAISFETGALSYGIESVSFNGQPQSAVVSNKENPSMGGARP